MLAAIKYSKAFAGEEETFLEEIVALAETQGYKCRDEQSIHDVFGHAEFEDWDFSKAPQGTDSPVHKAAIRKLLQSARKNKNLSDDEEDGEVHTAPEANEQLKLLSEAIAKCSGKAKSKEIHIETAKALKQECGNWGNVAHYMLPCAEGTNLMASELEKLKNKGIKKPFVKVTLAKFLPEWHNERFQEGFLLSPQVLMPTLMRWAMACQANNMLPMHIGATHADICMRVASEAKMRGKNIATAAAYDEIKQKCLAEMCLKGVSNFDPETTLANFDREAFEQA